MNQFLKKQGLLERPKFDEILVKDNEAKAMISYVQKYMKRKSSTKRPIPDNEADKQVKEVLNIMRGVHNSSNTVSKRSLSVSGGVLANNFKMSSNLNFAPSTDFFEIDVADRQGVF